MVETFVEEFRSTQKGSEMPSMKAFEAPRKVAEGYVLEREVLQEVKEPTVENCFRVGERTVLDAGKRNRRFRNHFGGEVVLPRRCYKFRDGKGGGYIPLDEKLGLDHCLGYSQLLSYPLRASAGVKPLREPPLLEEVLGFSVNATAVQRNTEAVGERITDNLHAMITAVRGQNLVS